VAEIRGKSQRPLNAENPKLQLRGLQEIPYPQVIQVGGGGGRLRHTHPEEWWKVGRRKKRKYSTMKFVQINLHHHKAATTVLSQKLAMAKG
jgi:hypothetical protein